MAKPTVNEQAKYYEGIFKVASQGIIHVDHEGLILRVNPAFEKILGYKAHEVLGKNFFVLAYSNQKMMQITSHNSLRRFYQSEKSSMELTLLDKNGKNIPVRFQAVLIRDEHNQVKQAIGIIEHMVELTGTDEAGDSLAEKMWEAQQNFDNILNNSADAILILDITGNIMTVNTAFQEMLGYALEEVMGKHIVEISASEEGTFVTTMGDEIIIDREYINNTSGKSVELYEKGFVKNWETHFVRKDKVIVPIEATLSMLKDKNGDRRGSIVIARDIAERKKTEKESREIKDFLENIFKTAADGILVTDNKGIITVVNDATVDMLGYSKEEIIGKGGNIFEPEGEEYDTVSSEYVAKLLKEGTITGFEFVWLKKDGKLIDVEVNAALLKDSKDNITGAVTSIRDISDRKQQEEKLKQEYGEMEVCVEERTAELDESRTEWMQREKELMESTLDSIMFTEQVGYVTKVNKHFLELLGYSEDEVVGKFVAELTPMDEGGTYESTTGETIKIDKAFLDRTQTMIEELLTQGKILNWEAYYLRKDKKVIPIEQNIVCLYDSKGERTGAISIIRDITDRKQAEKELKSYRDNLEHLVKERTTELRETKDYLDNIIENSLDCIIIGDSTGNITRVNESFLKLIGYQQEEIIGKHIMELSITEEGQYESTTGEIVTLGEELFEEARKIIYEKLFEDGEICNWSTYYLRKDRKIIPVEQNISYLYNKEGDIIGSVGITRDITERKKQEEELKKAYNGLERRIEERTSQFLQAKKAAEGANSAKSDFLANMSHELRTPLNHIIGFTELVVDKKCGELNAVQEEYLDDTLKSSRHLLSLINDILDLSKVEAGKFELEPTEFDPRMLIENSLTMFKEKALKHGIDLVSDVDHIPETIAADERKLKQIVYNILANAMKFTPDGGTVSLSAQLGDCTIRPGQRWDDPADLRVIEGQIDDENGSHKIFKKCVRFSISDTGIGIKKEDQDRIFAPFEQADGSSGRRYEGTGLGLPLTRKLVELHGGSIWVESAGEGKGSTFSFTIPI